MSGLDEKRIVVALLDCATGNGSVGTEWTEAALFDPNTPISEILGWAQGRGLSTADLRIRYAADERKEPPNA